MTSLDQLLPGMEASILGLAEDSLSAERLAVLGFIPGTRVRVIRRAPFGDPVLFEVGGRRVSLRRLDATSVHLMEGASA